MAESSRTWLAEQPLRLLPDPTARQAKSGQPEQARAKRIGSEAMRDMHRGDQIGHADAVFAVVVYLCSAENSSAWVLYI